MENTIQSIFAGLKTSLKIGKKKFQFDLLDGIDISVSVARKDGVSAFNIPNAKYYDYQDGAFVGSMERGAPCNLESITFTPHGNGTHTECIGHIVEDQYFVNEQIQVSWLTASLQSASPSPIGPSDLQIEEKDIDWDILGLPEVNALIIRTLPNSIDKKKFQCSGTNPPFLSSELTGKLASHGIDHLLVDLPSIDKEEDQGVLAAHNAFWNTGGALRLSASITEFIFVPSDLEDGLYALDLNVARFQSDAAPSRPTIFGLKEAND